MEKIKEIVKQLKFCNFQCESGPLEKNTAFIELEKAAQKNNIEAEHSASDNTTNSAIALLEQFKEVLTVDGGLPVESSIKKINAVLAQQH